MKRLHFTGIELICIAVIVVVGSLWAWSLFPGAWRGSVAARFDVARGHLEVQGFGLAAEWRPEYAKLLSNRYGIGHRTVAGCVVSQSLVSYVETYNRIMRAATERKFGRDVIAECASDAAKAWKDRAATEARTLDLQ